MRAKILTLSVLSIFIVAVFAAFVSAATLAEWDFEDSDLVVDTGSGTLTLSDSRTATFATGNAPSALKAMSSTGWDVADRYIELSVSTSGSENLVIEFDQQASTSGPTEFKLQYSSDGSTFTDLSGSTTSTVSSFTTNPMHTFDFSSITSIDDNVNTKFRILVPSTGTGSTSSGTFRIDNLDVQGTAIPTPTEPSEVTACSNIGNPGDLRIKGIDFENLGSLTLKETTGNIYLEFGDDDEWFPLDDLEIELEVENNGDEDVDDIEVEWGLYNTKRNEMVIDFDEEDEVNIKDGDDEIIDVEFNLEDELDVDLDDLDDGNHYRFYVIATGDVDNQTADRTCASDFENVEIVLESDFVVLTDVQFPESVQCGETVQVSAKVWNIGEDDQDEVKVEVHNNDLGLFHKTTEIGDIDAFDDDVYNFNFKVPNDAEEKTHSLMFSVLDEDFDVYENDFDDDESEFSLPFRVSGGCFGSVGAGSGVLVSANLQSGGKAGEQLVVRATVTNNDDELQAFTVNAAGFGQWASSYTADRTSLVLVSGASTDVLFTFDVNKDASGTQSFIMELVSEDNQVTTQPVSVVIEGKSSVFSGLTGSVTGNNAYLWGIGIINVILVLVIIIVAVRVLRK